jgi:O-acetyl-ADP-ribose deacetylase (regulator of RNase III)
MIINKDITLATEPYILHQVNCQNVMGSGVAKALATKWSKVKHQYHRYCIETLSSGKTNKDLLGAFDIVNVSENTNVINCYTQFTFGRTGLHTDYDVIRKVFNEINNSLNKPKVAIPYLYGCGLGGGDWKVVLSIIEDIFGDNAMLYKL